jgi:hypothetical protein
MKKKERGRDREDYVQSLKLKAENKFSLAKAKATEQVKARSKLLKELEQKKARHLLNR